MFGEEELGAEDRFHQRCDVVIALSELLAQGVEQAFRRRSLAHKVAIDFPDQESRRTGLFQKDVQDILTFPFSAFAQDGLLAEIMFFAVELESILRGVGVPAGERPRAS